MKILLLTNLFPPFSRGGAEQIVRRQAELFSSAGHEVVVVSTMPDVDVPIHDPDMYRVVRLQPKNLYHPLHDTHQPFFKRLLWHGIDLFSSSAESITKVILNKERPDVIITHNLKGFGLRAVRAIAASGIRHIHVLHDLQLIVPSGLRILGEEDHWQSSGWIHNQYVSQTRTALGSPDLVVSPSRFLLEEHLARGFFSTSSSTVIPNPIPWDIEPVQDPTHPATCVFVGQLEPHKGAHDLLQAWESIHGAELHVLGSGSLENELRERASISSNIRFYGRTNRKHLREVLQTASCLVVPSRCYENTPTVIIEALSLGVPVVANRIGGIAEMVPESCGILVEPGNVSALRGGIQSILDNAVHWSQQRAPIQKHAVQTYGRATYDQAMHRCLTGDARTYTRPLADR